QKVRRKKYFARIIVDGNGGIKTLKKLIKKRTTLISANNVRKSLLLMAIIKEFIAAKNVISNTRG
ncbi:MAG TPA: hypothetical protein PKK61_03885, partial [Defluviitaleaceae bacterium]|nr:hypothetical protein [Defluviitaleaceae bacterium]